MIGMLAGLKAPEKFAAQVMVAPSPRFLNDGDYIGGFSQQDIESLLETLDSNYLGWSSAMAPVIMGTLRIIDNIGHCPHLSQPSASISAIEEFLRSVGH